VQTPRHKTARTAHKQTEPFFRRLLGCYRTLTDTVRDVQNYRNAFTFKHKDAPVFWRRLTLKMKGTRYFQTPVTIQQTTRGNIPEDWNLQQYSCKDPNLAKNISFHVLSQQTHCHILSARNTSRNSSGTRLTRLSSILPQFLKTTGLVTILLNFWRRNYFFLNFSTSYI